MEKFGHRRQQDAQRPRKLSAGIRAALAGASFLAASAVGIPDSEHLKTTQAAEAHEAFNAEIEANAFLDRITNEEEAFNDVQGRRELRMRINAKLTGFALACARRIPVYSGGEVGSEVEGKVTPQMVAAATRYLLPRLAARRGRSDSTGLKTLAELLSEIDGGISIKDQEGARNQEASAHRYEVESRPSGYEHKYPGDDWK